MYVKKHSIKIQYIYQERHLSVEINVFLSTFIIDTQIKTKILSNPESPY